MLAQPEFPGIAPSGPAVPPGRPIRTVIGDIVRRFLRATKPRARAGAGLGAITLQLLGRAVVWADVYVAAAAGIAALYALAKARAGLEWAKAAIPLALLATVLVLARGVWRLTLAPFQHVALSVVAAGVTIEALLAGRVFTQLAYQDHVDGLGGSVLSFTDGLVAPFRGLEGSSPLHHTGVVEFATLTAIEAYLVATIAGVLLLTFWSEFLHMYRRVHGFFVQRSVRRQERPADGEPPMEAAPADLTAAS